MADPVQPQSQFYVTLDGAPAPPELTHALLRITVESSLHLPATAAVVLNDPQLHWIDAPALEPGRALQISAQSGMPEKPLFDGEIVEMEPEFGAGTQRLAVRAFDRLHRLGRGRRVRSFLNVTDGDLARKVAQEVGLSAEVGPAAQVHDYVLQSNQTNLEFLRGRATALGYLLHVRGKVLHFAPPKRDGQPVELQWGQGLQEFRPRMTTLEQVSGVTARGWDPSRRAEIVGKAGNGRGAPQVGEKRSGAALAQDAFHLEAPCLVADRPIRTQAAADSLAQAAADRRASRFIEAEGVCGGNPAVIAGAMVRITGVGDRFSGAYFVTAASHVYRPESGYTTHFTVSGSHPATLISLLLPEPEPVAAPGLVIGIVTDNQDPQGQGRVKVRYPALSGEHGSDWARVVAVGGGAERGVQFLPEVNDEVLVGFEMGDIHHPYVLGGLWNGQDPPPERSAAVRDGKVEQRLIRSRSGHRILLDDKEGGGGVTVEDRRGNRIVLDSAENSLTIEVQGNASLKARGNLSLEATGQVKIQGTGVQVEGGAGTVDVKGSLINLN